MASIAIDDDSVDIPNIVLSEQSSTPATPAAGKARLFVDAGAILKVVDDAGTVIPAGVIVSDLDVSNPPTAAELDAEFGTPPDGTTIVIDDNGAGTTLYWVVRKNSTWWHTSMTAAT